MIKSGFFDSRNGDRRYASQDMAYIFSLLMTNGVYADTTTALQVVAGTNMTIKVNPGFGVINGRYAYNTDAFPITLANASGVYPRIDRIVLRLNFTERAMQIVAITGTPAASPVAPAVVRDGTFYDLSFATIAVEKGCTAITQAKITDTRADNTVCGFVTGAVNQIDTTNLFAQFTSAFNTWFTDMKNQLSTDAAGNLQNQIDNIDTKIAPLTNTGINGSILMSDGTVYRDVIPLVRVNKVLYNGSSRSTYANPHFVGSDMYYTCSGAVSLSTPLSDGVYIVEMNATSIICSLTPTIRSTSFMIGDVVFSFTPTVIHWSVQNNITIYSNGGLTAVVVRQLNI